MPVENLTKNGTLEVIMERCSFVNPDNLERSKNELALELAVVARPDSFLRENECPHIIVETTKGVHLRCYLGVHDGRNFLILYGRFDRVRSTSYDIDFVSTQEVVSMLGIKKLIGTFVCGSIQDEVSAGEVFILHDFVGLGGYNESRNKNSVGFRNVDMFNPFCPKLRSGLIAGGSKVDFPIRREGIYACFHGFPRIETGAELDFYAKMGWQVVGQTLDPEATLAREVTMLPLPPQSMIARYGQNSSLTIKPPVPRLTSTSSLGGTRCSRFF